MFPEVISNSEVNQLPLVRFEGKIEIVQDTKRAKEVIKELLKQEVLGFDTESPPAFKKGDSFLPTLIQLASDDVVYLFQIIHLENIEWAVPLFASDVKKVGVALHDDIVDLKKYQDFAANAFINVADLSKKLGIVNTGLRKLTALILKKRISKGAQVSNWGKRKLDTHQTVYAATDAWISLLLYKKLSVLTNSVQ